MGGSDSLSLRPVVQAVRNRLPLVVLCVLICLLGGVAWIAAAPRVYEAQASLYVDPTSPDGLQTSDGLLSPYFASEATSRRVLTRVLDSPSGPDGMSVDQLRQKVTAQPLRGTNVIVVSAEAEAPTQAAQLANALADAVVAQNRADASARQKQTQQYLQNELNRIEQQLQALRGIPASDPQRQAELALLEGQYGTTYTRLQDVTLSQSRASDSLSVLETAQPPTKPIQPQPPLDLGIALAGGLFLGLLVAFAVDRLDDRLLRSEALGHAIGASLVASIAHGDGRDAMSTAEAHLMARHPGVRIVLVAPAGPGDPAPDVARLLAAAGQQAGRKVQLIDLASPWDLHGHNGHSKGSYERIFSVRGLDEGALAIVAVPSPHLAPTAATLAQSADLAVLVGTAGQTSAREARRAAEALRRIGVPVEAGFLVAGAVESKLRRLMPWRRLNVA